MSKRTTVSSPSSSSSGYDSGPDPASPPPALIHATRSFLNQPAQKLISKDYFRRLYNAPKRTHRFKAIEFKPQATLLEASAGPFSGFFTLFWMIVALLILNSMRDTYARTHTLLGPHIINYLKKDLLKVALVDLQMYIATYFGVGLQLLVKHGIVSWTQTGWILQNVWQTIFLFYFMWVAEYMQFPWIARVFLLLHSLVLLMKQHSYAFFNGYLWSVLTQVKVIDTALKKDTSTLSLKDTKDLAEFRTFIAQELTQQDGPNFPDNISLKNYFEFSMFPTLVYRMAYPRTSSIRWGYVGEKTLATFGVFLLMIIVAENSLYPIAMEALSLRGLSTMEKVQRYPAILVDLIPPFVLMILLVFYIIWDAILNGIAELTRFADRGFYGAWWNCVTWDQFARDWNTPVHLFLLQHVYHSTISVFNVSKRTATLYTFLLSSCIHELVMFVIFKNCEDICFVCKCVSCLWWPFRARVT